MDRAQDQTTRRFSRKAFTHQPAQLIHFQFFLPLEQRRVLLFGVRLLHGLRRLKFATIYSQNAPWAELCRSQMRKKNAERKIFHGRSKLAKQEHIRCAARSPTLLRTISFIVSMVRHAPIKPRSG